MNVKIEVTDNGESVFYRVIEGQDYIRANGFLVNVNQKKSIIKSWEDDRGLGSFRSEIEAVLMSYKENDVKFTYVDPDGRTLL
ncbi:hypothetical protein [Paenibacillus wynnii]|uniref:Uncharacterized protein n=1 Tax=Paenibacillus wynnii TaxID=268407 RepID=A0A098M7R2_9BACL|nr:hypothetical protein [Paenibacillus wynnii]KGE17582.1 hypothetical protein PWYN_23610 [Paenibacillus wynnii]